jgi:beta-mannosidase
VELNIGTDAGNRKSRMVTNTPSSHHLLFGGGWQVCSAPLDADDLPDALPCTDAITVPDCAHLQPILYPDQPYWGSHLRAINERAWVYRKAFSTPDVRYQRARLRFDGVDYFASVWLNGHFVGRHEGNFAPFTFDVTKALLPGAENRLVVQVSSPWDRPNGHGNYPLDHVIRGLVKGLYEHGEGVIPPDVNPLGIWRPVWLLLDEGLSLDLVRIRAGTDGQVDVRITMSNSSGEYRRAAVQVDVVADNHDGPGPSASVEIDLPPGTHVVNQRLLIPDARLWWPWDHGDPNMYRLTLTLRDTEGRTHDTLTEAFGLRTVQLDRSPDRFTYTINGRTVFIRGSAYIPDLYLSRCNRDSLARDLSLARNANLNLLRVHTHVSPPDLYDLCDRMGMLVWQDFELNWVHDPSPGFEARARTLQRDMLALLGNHPSVITWACHNEPTMILARRQNLERHPDPALYADAIQEDPTRPVFICSGQAAEDWQRAGDAHTYYGALWTTRYADVYKHRYRLNTEFGFEAPADRSTLQTYPLIWERLGHLDDQIEALWHYQAELTRFHVEHLRRLRAEGCAGYIHFWLVDLVPQVGCGVLDSNRLPKGGYEALRESSQPLHVALEHDGRHPYAIWVFNDTPFPYPDHVVGWKVYGENGSLLLDGEIGFDVTANATQRVIEANWPLAPPACARIDLDLYDANRNVVSSNSYRWPFQPPPRPRGYPWKFDPFLGVKVFARPDAPSLADQHTNPLFGRIPLAVRERVAEWILRQQLPRWLVSVIARAVDRLVLRTQSGTRL